YLIPSPRATSRPWLLALGLCLFSLVLGPALSAQSATGSLSGRVSNAATNAFLQGALVEIRELNRQTFTDSIGEYRFVDLPAGTYTVVASYLGLDAMEQNVRLEAGARVVSHFDLESGVYRLAEFTVSGEREGQAASITRQRTAPNVKNVVA